MRRVSDSTDRGCSALIFIVSISAFVLMIATIVRSLLIVLEIMVILIILGTGGWAFSKKPSRSKTLLLAFFFIISLSSVVGWIIESLPETGGRFICWDSDSFRIGYASSGSVISGSFSAEMGSAGFFIVDEGNHSRWQDGLSYDSYSDTSGFARNINFIVPYDDT
ncbi:MAG: hypothetical protein ACFE7S_03460 [Candidatus Hodarchaeota archaeon]